MVDVVVLLVHCFGVGQSRATVLYYLEHRTLVRVAGLEALNGYSCHLVSGLLPWGALA